MSYIANSSSRQVLQSGISVFSFLVLEHISLLSEWMGELLTDGLREIPHLQSYDI